VLCIWPFILSPGDGESVVPNRRKVKWGKKPLQRQHLGRLKESQRVSLYIYTDGQFPAEGKGSVPSPFLGLTTLANNRAGWPSDGKKKKGEMLSSQ